MKLELFYPVRPFSINQHFGDNLPCVKNFGLPTQKIVTGTQNSCPEGFEKLYKRFGMLGHSGVDLQAGEQNVYAAHSGTVIEKQTVPARGLGVGVLTDEQYDFPEGTHFVKVRDWHLKSFAVEVGEHVEAGDLIGVSNNTGYSSGDHLHFELQLMDKDTGGHPSVVFPNNGYGGAINPEPYFNGKYADEQKLSPADTVAVVAAETLAKGNEKDAGILFKIAQFIKAFFQ